jgi:predicted O-linked N-acetylglucosamine transferase (SPINDLY family)
MSAMTIEQVLDLAVQHHQAGRLREAEALYRQILAHQPQHIDALHLLGVIAQQIGRNDVAVDLIGRALAGRPDWPEGLNNLGNALVGAGNLDAGIDAYQRAIALRPEFAEALNNLGNALKRQNKSDKAVDAYRKAIALSPGYAEAHNNLGAVLWEQKQLAAARTAYEQAIALAPQYAEAHTGLGNVLRDLGEISQAIAEHRIAIHLKPGFAEAHSNLGDALRGAGQADESVTACRQAISLNPQLAEAHNNLGNALRDLGELDQAILAYDRAIELKPDYAEAFCNRGNALRDDAKTDEAAASFRQAIALRPAYARAFSGLGNALKDKGQLHEAMAEYRQAINFDSSDSELHSNLIFSLNYLPDCDAEQIAIEQRRWNQQHAEPLHKLFQPHANDPDPNRRLRIGYVSADFRRHASAHFLLPLMMNHDPGAVEFICYAQVAKVDEISRQMQQRAADWINTIGLSDDQLAAKIRQDRIDILVDLKMHTGGNRLMVFATKPAPLQVCWLGYPGSTGMSAIDYRLSDPWLDPPGMNESIYAERTVRLPHSFWCYDPLDGREIPVNPLPAATNGFVTFGCLNNFCKINDQVVALWSAALDRVDRSRLLLLAPAGSHRQDLLARFAAHAVDPGRIEFVPYQSRADYLRTYHRIDVGLDTFPYNGHTTSLDSYWMGVPVLSLIGDRAVARAGWGFASNLGLQELAADTVEAFVQNAVELTSDLARLARLRSALRLRLQRCPLMNGPEFARNVEAACRHIWRQWCRDTTQSNYPTGI